MRTLLTLLFIFALSGCGPHYVVPSQESGRPLFLVSSAYTPGGCIENLHEEAERLEVGLQSLGIKGWFFGDTLLWPIYKGYTCNAAVALNHERG